MAKRRIVIETPSRLHFGIINPFTSKYRLYVSAGVAIDYPRTRVIVYPDEALSIEGCRSEEVYSKIRPLIEEYDIKQGRVIVEESVPKHVGLGSTTQLLLSVVHGLLVANDKAPSSPREFTEIARKLGIGRISGVGTYIYLYGGFIVDGGKKSVEDFPLLFLRLEFPEEWRFVVVVPPGRGMSELEERAVFTKGTDVPSEAIWEASFTLFHELVPALIEKDFNAFSRALSRLQEVVGSMFSSFQGGVFASYSARAVSLLRKLGILGVGQSSWGPAVYGVIESREKATEIARIVKSEIPSTEVFVAKPRNRGASIKVELY